MTTICALEPPVAEKAMNKQSRKSPNPTLETNRRPDSPLDAWWKFGPAPPRSTLRFRRRSLSFSLGGSGASFAYFRLILWTARCLRI